MKLVDADMLIYASDARHRLASALAGSGTVLIPWFVAVAYVRTRTNPQVFRSPLAVSDAAGVISTLLRGSNVITGESDAQHFARVTQSLAPLGRGGDLVNDAQLAAIAQQNGATVGSDDLDFRFFPDVRWERTVDFAN